MSYCDSGAYMHAGKQRDRRRQTDPARQGQAGGQPGRQTDTDIQVSIHACVHVRVWLRVVGGLRLVGFL